MTALQATAQTNEIGYRLRRLIKEALQSRPTEHDGLVVASFGRAGSTLVYGAAVDAMCTKRYGSATGWRRRIVEDEAFDLETATLRPGVVYKTHAYPDYLAGRTNLRAVFLFGSAKDAALSVHEQKHLRSEDWVKDHFEHLRRPYRYDMLLSEDALGFRDQCVAWMGCTEIPVLCMRYEGLWDNVATLSAFCGLDVRLPEQRARKPKELAPKLMAQAEATYGTLDADMAKLPDCFEAAPEYGEMMKLR